MIVSDFCDIFLNEAKRVRAIRTICAYAWYIRKYIIPNIGSLDISTITRSHIEGIIEASGAFSSEGKVATGNGLLSILKAIFRRAEELDYVPRGFNPTIEVPRFRQLRPPESLDDDDLLKLGSFINKKIGAELSAIDRSVSLAPEFELRIRRSTIECGAVIFLLLSGVNQINTKKIRWDDVDFDSKLINIPNFSRIKHQTIPITDKIEVILGVMPRVGPYVFTGSVAKVEICNLAATWRRMTIASGIKGKAIRAARHTFALNAAEAGVGSHRLLAMLGYAPERKWQVKFHDPAANFQYWEKVSNIIWRKMNLDANVFGDRQINPTIFNKPI